MHECDGKAPPQLPVKLETLVPETCRSSESVRSTGSDVHVETKVTSSTSTQQPQVSAVSDARSKFEQVLQASKHAAAAAAGSASIHTHGDNQLLTTDDAVDATCCRNPENDLMSSLQYSRLVCTYFALGTFCVLPLLICLMMSSRCIVSRMFN